MKEPQSQYLYEDFPKAPRLPSGRRPWGLEHRTSSWAYSVDVAPAAAVLCTQQTVVSGRAVLPHCVQTRARDKYRHCQPGSSDKQQPAKRKRTQTYPHQTPGGQVWKQQFSVRFSFIPAGEVFKRDLVLTTSDMIQMNWLGKKQVLILKTYWICHLRNKWY